MLLLSRIRRFSSFVHGLGALRSAALGLIAVGLLLSLRLSFLTGDQPWFHPILKIDGGSYINGLEMIGRTHDFLNLKDIYHSPGYQMYLGALRILYPFDAGFFFTVKLIANFLFAATIGMVIFLGERVIGCRAGWLAGALLALSLPMQAYVNLLQGEVLQAFLFTALAVLLVTASPAAERPHAIVTVIGCSLIASYLVLLQVRFLPILPLAAVAIALRARAAGVSIVRPTCLLLLPGAFLLAVWSMHHSGERDAFVFVATGSEFRLRVAYNPNASGFAYPYPHVVEPSGLDFVVQHPARVAWLIKERFFYLWNWKRDIWDLGGWCGIHGKQDIVPTAVDIPMHIFDAILSFIGALFIFWPWKRIRPGESVSAFAAWGLTVVAGPLFVFGSSRFLVPLLPLVALLQAHAISTIHRWFLDRRTMIR